MGMAQTLVFIANSAKMEKRVCILRCSPTLYIYMLYYNYLYIYMYIYLLISLNFSYLWRFVVVFGIDLLNGPWARVADAESCKIADGESWGHTGWWGTARFSFFYFRSLPRRGWWMPDGLTKQSTHHGSATIACMQKISEACFFTFSLRCESMPSWLSSSPRSSFSPFFLTLTEHLL